MKPILARITSMKMRRGVIVKIYSAFLQAIYAKLNWLPSCFPTARTDNNILDVRDFSFKHAVQNTNGQEHKYQLLDKLVFPNLLQLFLTLHSSPKHPQNSQKPENYLNEIYILEDTKIQVLPTLSEISSSDIGFPCSNSVKA